MGHLAKCYIILRKEMKNIGLLSIFSGSKKKKAAVFIDYEHWYIALDKNFHTRPDIVAFTDEIHSQFDVASLSFFGDFSNPSLNSEMHKIRGFTNTIVETNNGGGFYKKDFTDFIMLDHIYRCAYTEKNIDTYIIFTGDSHFSSVVLFLKNTCKKNVIVYGIKGAFSGQLKQTASRFCELPYPVDELAPYKQMVLSSLYALSCEHKNPRASFVKTVSSVSEKYSADEALVKSSLEQLISDGYVIQYEQMLGKNRVRLLRADFHKAKKDGVFKPESSAKK